MEEDESISKGMSGVLGDEVIEANEEAGDNVEVSKNTMVNETKEHLSLINSWFHLSYLVGLVFTGVFVIMINTHFHIMLDMSLYKLVSILVIMSMVFLLHGLFIFINYPLMVLLLFHIFQLVLKSPIKLPQANTIYLQNIIDYIELKIFKRQTITKAYFILYSLVLFLIYLFLWYVFYKDSDWLLLRSLILNIFIAGALFVIIVLELSNHERNLFRNIGWGFVIIILILTSQLNYFLRISDGMFRSFGALFPVSFVVVDRECYIDNLENFKKLGLVFDKNYLIEQKRLLSEQTANQLRYQEGDYKYKLILDKSNPGSASVVYLDLWDSKKIFTLDKTSSRISNDFEVGSCEYFKVN